MVLAEPNIVGVTVYLLSGQEETKLKLDIVATFGLFSNDNPLLTEFGL